MTEENAYLQSILADPHDMAPRLVFADWLDEHGQEERATFIRQHRPAGLHHDAGPAAQRVASSMALCRISDIFRAGHRLDCLTHFDADQCPFLFSEMAVLPPGGTEETTCLVRHGFVHSVLIHQRQFPDLARELFAREPIADVCLVDVFGSDDLGGNDPDEHLYLLTRACAGLSIRRAVYGPIFDALPVRLDRTVRGPGKPLRGRSALSRACVNFGRQLAGLPALAASPECPRVTA